MGIVERYLACEAVEEQVTWLRGAPANAVLYRAGLIQTRLQVEIYLTCKFRDRLNRCDTERKQRKDVCNDVPCSPLPR